MEMRIETLEAQPVASIRTTCAPADIGATLATILPEVAKALEQNGAAPAGAPFARYHSFSDGEVDLDGGIAVTEPFQGSGRVVGSELPAGRYAIVVHRGPYATLGDTYGEIHEWLATTGEESRAGSWELYVDDPTEVPSAELRTEIYVPLV